MFDGFEVRDIATRETSIRARIGGAGPPLLLLHGYPQTHAMWHRVAPALAERHTVVCADLRGYGDSGRPASDAEHAAYSKRASAQDMVEVMAALGHERFMLAGHDRGGRVGHRLASDHPERVGAPGGTRHRADAHHLPRHRPGDRDRLLPLVLPDPAGRPAGAADRRRSTVLPALDARPLGNRQRRVRARGARRIRALLSRSRGDPRQLRGLPRRRLDRPRPRRGRPGAQDPVPAAGTLGQARADGAPFRRARHLARESRRPGQRPRARLRPLPRRGATAGDGPRSSWRSSDA